MTLDEEIKEIFRKIKEEPIEPTKMEVENPEEFKRVRQWYLEDYCKRLEG